MTLIPCRVTFSAPIREPAKLAPTNPGWVNTTPKAARSGGTLAKTYTPASFVVFTVATPVSMFSSVICAFGTRAPVGSEAVPDIVALVVWISAKRIGQRSRITLLLYWPTVYKRGVERG